MVRASFAVGATHSADGDSAPFAGADPDAVGQVQEGKWGCVMWLAASAVKGRPATCDAATFGCIGGGVGMGFGDCYKSFPGSEEGFCHFLSSGIEG
ncbi:MAG: DUF169 domain-containing protein [Proteobacteria bacterium]|nr:DUF169 domain-containing protein [Pseudomonadota bacterium]MBU2226845.1 DUF169 domain-containing protein [Pseudomonadota bacterium]MBU2261723.1 DUF169 domain-containing protein [Pseudomonadota bacterium]